MRQSLGAACASLPSSQAAADALAGEEGAWLDVAGSMLGRAVLIGAGLAVVGEREHLVRNSIAGACAIEVFVLGWIVTHRGEQ